MRHERRVALTVGYFLCAPIGALPSSPETSKKPRKRRCFKDLQRDVKCLHEGCGRVYATESSLQTHIRLKHNNIGPDGKPQPERVKRKPAQPKATAPDEKQAKETPEIRRLRTQSMPVTKSKTATIQTKVCLFGQCVVYVMHVK